MRYVVWALRAVVFFIVLMFALKNTEPVAINFYGSYTMSDVPLIVVMLVTFVIGAIFGLLLVVPSVARRRREAMRLRRELDRARTQAKLASAGAQAVPPEIIAPMSPL
jgi:uncharacterized integral membrane protein